MWKCRLLWLGGVNSPRGGEDAGTHLPLLSAGLGGIGGFPREHSKSLRGEQERGSGGVGSCMEDSGEALRQVEGAEQPSFQFSLVCFSSEKPFSVQGEAG